MEQKREFTGIWIPRQLVEDERLDWTDRALYGEIQSFNNCFKSNESLGERIGESARNVQKRIARLKEYGYIVQTGFDGRKRYLQACLPVRGRHVQLDTPDTSSGTPIDNSIENILTSEQSSQKSDTSFSTDEDDLVLEEVDDDGVPISTVKKKDTSYRSVFQCFYKIYPTSWNRNRTEIQAAKALLEERGIEQVKKALSYYRKHQNEQFIPRLSTPSELDRKWDKLIEYRDRA